MLPQSIHPSTILELESELGERTFIGGLNCRIRLGANVRFEAALRIMGDVVNATLEIGDDCVIGGVIRLERGDGGVIRIGAGTTFNQVGLSMHEAGEINIGRDCMFSTDIHMDPSDMHPIFDRATGERLNPAQDINIGDHVWLGTRVLVLKGARIGSGTIVGAGSIVSGTLPGDVLAVGSPAKVVRENVVWTRDLDQAPPLRA
ncbi:MAG TPA: acyltransferase [Polyangia bacterium]|nr:acyltransferase [Polyangia bacterium]